MINQTWLSRYLQLGLVGSLLGVIGVGDSLWDSCASRIRAQIAPDNTLGAESSVVTPNVVIRDIPSERLDGGAIRGANLFHSFQEFNVGSGRGAYFTNPAGIENILSRVTGGSRSNILGRLGVLGNANLFLINPNGVMFGPSSSLDVNGSFVTTSANAIGFGDQGFFSASAPNVPAILTVNPSAFLFNQIAGSITNQSVAGLQVPLGQSLLLLGGDVTLEGGILQAPGGRVELGGVASSGTVGLNVDSNRLLLSFPDDVVRADVYLTAMGSNTATVNVAASNGGNIAITARNIDISGDSVLRGGLETGSRFPGVTAGDITLNATGAIKIANGFIFNYVRTGAVGKGGNIDITAETLSLSDGAILSTDTFGKGDAGRVSVQTDGIVSVTGDDTAIFSDVNSTGSGNAGGIVITAGLVFLREGAQLSSSTYGNGDAGSVVLQASDSVSLENGQIVTNVSSRAKGNGGNIDIRAGSLSLTNGAGLDSNTLGQGNAGAVSVQARDLVSVANSRIDSSAQSIAVGKGGDITIQAGLLSLSDNAYLAASNFGQGDAGNISMQVRDAVSLERRAYISTSVASVESEAVGNAGNIDIRAGSLSLTDNASLYAVTDGRGDAGNISVQATDEVSLTNSSLIINLVSPQAVGKGGDINIQAHELSLTNGAALVSSTLGQGDAGNVNIDVSDAVSLEGGAFILTEVASVESEAVGNGGNIDIRAGSLSLIDGGQVSAQSQATGRAGNITINADRDLNANNGKIIAAASIAGGGNINVTATDIRLRGNSDIRTNLSRGLGSGGNINLTANTIVALDDSDILAFASEGRGGNITFRTSVFLNSTLYRPALLSTLNALDGNLLVDINASGAIAGAISGVPDVSFLQNSFTELPENLINTNLLIANSCITGSSRQGGSFIITSADGFPTRPGDASISHYPTGTVRSITSSGSSSETPRSSVSGTNPASPWKLGDPIVEPQGVYRLADGQLVLSRECQIKRG